MGKHTGFMDYARRENESEAPLTRVRHWREFHSALSLEARVEQGGRCMNCGVPFCQSGCSYGGTVFGCPLHNLIPEWNDMIWNRNLGHALSRLLKNNNFPEFTGRVCPALCEQACTCAVAGKEPVSVRENELGIIEDAFAHGRMQPRIPKVRSGNKVAVIGSGPAGLACADQLNQRGHTVTVFERHARPGGLLMYGIPNMKLDKAVVERRTALMQAEGVTFYTGVEISTRKQAKRLLDQYDCVVLCCGSARPREYPAAPPDVPGVSFAAPYLKAATEQVLEPERENPLSACGKDVVVIGAGYTSSDCVATALRQGCRSVTQLIRKPSNLARQRKGLWGPLPEEHDYAVEEAVAVFGQDPRQYETILTGLLTDEASGALCGVRTQKVCWKKTDGGLAQELLPGTERELPADLLLIANGFSGCETPVLQAFGLEANQRGNLCLEEKSHRTADERVFVAGDMRRGASLVVWAIAEGRAAAAEVDEYLTGYPSL